jgi:hypothetical protein
MFFPEKRNPFKVVQRAKILRAKSRFVVQATIERNIAISMDEQLAKAIFLETAQLLWWPPTRAERSVNQPNGFQSLFFVAR